MPKKTEMKMVHACVNQLDALMVCRNLLSVLSADISSKRERRQSPYRFKITFYIFHIPTSRAARILTGFVDHIFDQSLAVKDATIDDLEAHDFCTFLKNVDGRGRH